MSNRRKTKRPDVLIKQEAVDEGRINIPRGERVVAEEKPATIHWSLVKNSPREDSEVIGTAIIYEDGSTDLIVAKDISEEARALLYSFETHMYSIAKE